MTVAIDVHELNKSFGDKHVVKDVSIAVEEGRVTGFLGPNGSGKTTTMRMLCGLLTPDSGTGTCLGLDILTQQRRIKRLTGYMTQKFSLYDDLTIAENLRFIARIYGMRDRERRIRAALDKPGPDSRPDQLPGTLAGVWTTPHAQRAAVPPATTRPLPRHPPARRPPACGAAAPGRPRRGPLPAGPAPARPRLGPGPGPAVARLRPGSGPAPARPRPGPGPAPA